MFISIKNLRFFIDDNIKNLKTFKNYDFNNKILKEMINKMNLVSYNKRKIVQKTWNDDSDSDDDFQRDLEKETCTNKIVLQFYLQPYFRKK